MGDPRLLARAQPVEVFDTPELHALLADMQDTMAALDGAGLAAPQIGVGLQVVIFGVEQNPRYPDAEEVPRTVLINPTLTPLARKPPIPFRLPPKTHLCISNPRHRRGAPVRAQVPAVLDRVPGHVPLVWGQAA